MTTTNGWPGKPGVPMNPEQDGWHWVKARSDNLKPTRREKFPAQWTAGNQHWIHGTYAPEYAADNWIYLGPVLSHDEATALQARVAELEDLIRVKVTEIERAYPHEGHCIECHGVVRAWGNTEHRDDCWYVKARAALEGKKDE